jgi:3-phosphoshikimate 1-carboxyvinyltransferase
MKSAAVRAASGISGGLSVPGDKSITHRGVILGALAEGETIVHGYLPSDDCLRTVAAFRAMGVQIDEDSGTLRVAGRGLRGLREPEDVLDLGNSGTSIRLLAGLLSGQPFFSVMTGDASLRSRPMRRVIDPLRQMGANISGCSGGERAPLAIQGGPLKGIRYALPVASAQVKSALLLAGLYAEGETDLSEPLPSRDHTERLFRHFGLPLRRDGTRLRIGRLDRFEGKEIRVPGDFSSAAFFIVAATLIPDSEVRIVGVGVNPTRTGLLDVLKEMGARIELEASREEAGEPVADLVVRSSSLKGTTVRGEVIPRLIDEFPILCVAAALAKGETVIQDAGELRVKESDRIDAMVEALSAMGAGIQALPDGVVIQGGALRGGVCESRRDHRVAMAMIVAGLVARGETRVDDVECIDTSFPGFVPLLRGIAGEETIRLTGC